MITTPKSLDFCFSYFIENWLQHQPKATKLRPMKRPQPAGCLWRYDYLIFPICFQCAGTAGSKQSVTLKPVIDRATKRRLSPEDKWQHKRKQLQAIYWTPDATKGDIQLWQSHMLSSTLQNSGALSVSTFPCQSQTSWSHSFSDLRLSRGKHRKAVAGHFAWTWMLQWVSGLIFTIDTVAPGQDVLASRSSE